MNGDPITPPPSDDAWHAALRNAWQATRDQGSATGPIDASHAVPPDPSELAAALDGSLPSAERVLVLDRALQHGGGDDLALLYGLRHAAGRTGLHRDQTRSDRGTRSRWYKWSMPLAAGALLAVGIPLWRYARGVATQQPPVMRGTTTSAPQLLSPVADAAIDGDTVRLIWQPIPLAASYVVEVMDAGGTAIVTATTTDTTVQVVLATPEDRQRVVGWWVTAHMADGQSARSALRIITYRR